MSDPENPETPEAPALDSEQNPDSEPVPEPAPPARKPRRFRRFLLDLGISSTLLSCLAIILFFWASSAAFENSVRLRVIAELERATGGRVEIGSFHWSLLHLRIEAGNITIHGLEAANEAPYAHIRHISLQVAILGLFHWGEPTQVILREAEIQQPEFHLIVYPDGATNQPHPTHARKFDKPAIDSLFDAQIGRLFIEQGTVHIADKVVPLDLQAQDTSIQLSWVPDSASVAASSKPSQNQAGSYRIALSLGQLAVAQGKFKPIPSRLDAQLQLFRDSVRLDSLRLDSMNRVLTLSGQLSNFANPVWQADATGQVNLRVLEPLAALPFFRGGIVNVNAKLTGKEQQFQCTGDLASNAIHYQDPTVDAQTGAFSARFQCDQKRLLVSNVRARLAQGGEISGQFQFDNWLDNTPRGAAAEALLRAHKTWPRPTGMIRANLDGVSLDTILDMLANSQYRRLGLNAVFSGPATADWTGFALDLQIGGQLSVVPTATPVAGEVPVNGSVDAMFHSELGSIKVQTLDVHMPHSTFEGKGSLGVFPIDRASEMDIDIDSTDLSEFDGPLRALNLQRGSRIGAAALPVTLAGQAQFHGQLNSSWLTPRVEGRVTATNVGIEIPAIPAAANQSNSALPTSNSPAPASQPADAFQLVHWDSVDIDGLYTPQRIAINHGLLRRGASSLTLQGELDSTNPAYKIGDTEDEFDAHSILKLKAGATQFSIADLLPIAGISAPITGSLSGQIDIKGDLDTLTGSGSLDVTKANVYGESIDRLQATGSVSGRQLKISSLTAQQSSGTGRITGTGSYDFSHNTFQEDARGSSIELGSLEHLKNAGVTATGKLAFTAIGNGTFDDPHLQAKATFTGMTVAGEPVADLLVSASTANRAVTYDLSSKQPTGEFTAHGTTSFNTDYYTQASLQFSKFDIGALLKLLKVTGISGKSDLEGTAKVSGPLAHPEKLRGEASLNELAFAVEGVNLTSKGAVHATLVEGIARLDPIEITGEDTDLKLNGSLAVTGTQQLDLVASGSINLRLAETLDPDLIAAGATTFQMQAHGPLKDPILQGKVEFQNASLSLQDFPNGLSQIKGTLEFSQNRLEVRSLTALSGGGQLSVSGYLGFQHGLYADLTATGKAIRIRYPQGISSLADANLRLQGPQNNLLLSGSVIVNRFAINSDLDLTALASQTGSVPAIVSPDAPSNHVRLDVHLTSSPQLNFQNAYAKLAGDVDLHLHGTLAAPSLLGRISLTEGGTSVAGTKYDLQRGDINFNNPVRIQPNIDLEATARVEDYDITLGLHGTPEKLNVTYRSEPPLPEADVIALLALGRTQSEQTGYSQQQQQAGDNPMTDALLGGALNATVTNRVQRLFGTGAVKIDPNFIGSLGNSTARVTVVEQIGKNLTFTYASNVNTTTQQLIQAEYAINRHVSLLVTQDESGIFSVVVKTRRRYR